MRVGSLFAGVGGFDIAAERAGMTVAWQSENDKHASNVLAFQFPTVPNYGNVHTVTLDPDNIGAAHHAERVDVLVGGFPCQDYSIAGIRSGLAGDRGALWWEFHRLIAEGRPRWVVGENVPGLLSSRGGEDFATIIDSLTELGYRCAWRVLDAQYFGVAQRRRRVFIVASLGTGSPSQVLALSEGMSRHPAPIRQEGQNITGALTGGARSSSAGNPDDNRAQAGFLIPQLTGPLTVGMWKGPRGTEAVESNHIVPFTENSRNEVRIIDEENGGEIASALCADGNGKQQTYIMRQREGKPGGGKGPLLSEDQSLTLAANTNDQVLFTNAVAYDEFNDSLADTHHTLRAGTQQSTGVVDGTQVRRLTPLECERLQGFPDNWTATQSDTQRYRQMGNAVAVPVVEWVMDRLMDEHERNT